MNYQRREAGKKKARRLKRIYNGFWVRNKMTEDDKYFKIMINTRVDNWRTRYNQYNKMEKSIKQKIADIRYKEQLEEL